MNSKNSCKLNIIKHNQGYTIVITETRLFKYIENFTPKTESFQIKYSDIFHILLKT